ncbi:MAG: HNH endonuclease [Candidatus Acidiferrales bacterium]
MRALRQRKPRQRLDPERYRDLREQVLERDGWRCQSCGALRNLQVHHLQSRSRLGADRLRNLITLCVRCHRLEHLGKSHPFTYFHEGES